MARWCDQGGTRAACHTFDSVGGRGCLKSRDRWGKSLATLGSAHLHVAGAHLPEQRLVVRALLGLVACTGLSQVPPESIEPTAAASPVSLSTEAILPAVIVPLISASADEPPRRGFALAREP